MEFTLRTMVVLIIILIAAFVFASLILGWGNQANMLFAETFNQLRKLIFG